MPPVMHLYVHVPFCAHRCGYCDFVTVTGNEDRHGSYIDALLAEFDSERAVLGTPLETIFVGGGTPTLIGPELLDRLLDGLPAAGEITVEANPETVDDALAEVLVRHGARVSLGAQSFGARELAVLERRATPETVRAAVATLRRAGVDEPEPRRALRDPGRDARGARSRHRRGARARAGPSLVLRARGEAGHPLHVHARRRARPPGRAARGSLRARDRAPRGAPATAGTRRRTTAATIGAAGTTWRSGGARTTSASASARSRRSGSCGGRNGPRLAPYIEAIARGDAPIRVEEQLSPDERLHERIMLGLRLDEPMAVAPVRAGLDMAELRAARGPRAGRRGRRYADSHTTRPHGRERRHLEADQRMSDDRHPAALDPPGAAPAAGRRGAHRERAAGRLEVARAGRARRGVVLDGARRARRARGARDARPPAHLGRARARPRPAIAATPPSSCASACPWPRCRSTSRRRATSSTPRCARRPRRSRA